MDFSRIRHLSWECGGSGWLCGPPVPRLSPISPDNVDMYSHPPVCGTKSVGNLYLGPSSNCLSEVGGFRVYSLDGVCNLSFLRSHRNRVLFHMKPNN